MYQPLTGEQKLSVDNWGALVNGLLRPPRSAYDIKDLGGASITINNTLYTHHEMVIPFHQFFLELTLYKPSTYPTSMVVLYMHGNSSCKLEMDTLHDVLPPYYSLAGFDFLACGNSESPDYPFVSLGVREAQQVAAATRYLEGLGYYVVLWGRSMGAISALKFGGTQVIVADSACASLKRVCREQVMRGKPEEIPGCVVGCIFPIVYSKLRSDLKQMGNYDIEELNLKRIVAGMPIDKIIIFLSADEDTVIDAGNSQTLYNCYRGQDKVLLFFTGRHNTTRPDNVLSYVFQYIESVLKRRQSIFSSFQSFRL